MNIPNPPQALVEGGAHWAQGASAKIREADVIQGLRDSYMKGVAIFDIHRDRALERMEEHGGIAVVEYVAVPPDAPYDTPGSTVTYEDGEREPVDRVLDPAPLEFGLVQTVDLPKGASQTYEIGLSFGYGYGIMQSRNLRDRDGQ